MWCRSVQAKTAGRAHAAQGRYDFGRHRVGTLSDHSRHLGNRAARARWGHVALLAWAALSLVITGGLASAHWYALPHPPAAKPALVRALAHSLTAADSGRFTVTHVLYAECRCSQSILKHLVSRRARRDVSERVLLVAPDDALTAQLRAADYRVDVLKPTELKLRYEIESAPLLIVADPQHVLRYLGGYTTRKQAPDIHDTAIIDSVISGRDASELPLFGCAVSRRLQRLLDPLGLQYRANDGGT